MPGPVRRGVPSERRVPAITRGQERRARTSIPSNVADLSRLSVDAGVLMACMNDGGVRRDLRQGPRFGQGPPREPP
eukprot:3238853-Prymnesium_polylepis.1